MSDFKVFSMRIEGMLHKILKAYAAQEGRKLQYVITEALIDFINKNNVPLNSSYAQSLLTKSSPMNPLIREDLLQMRLYKESVEYDAFKNNEEPPDYIKPFTDDMKGLKVFMEFCKKEDEKKLEKPEKYEPSWEEISNIKYTDD